MMCSRRLIERLMLKLNAHSSSIEMKFYFHPAPARTHNLIFFLPFIFFSSLPFPPLPHCEEKEKLNLSVFFLFFSLYFSYGDRTSSNLICSSNMNRINSHPTIVWCLVFGHRFKVAQFASTAKVK